MRNIRSVRLEHEGHLLVEITPTDEFGETQVSSRSIDLDTDQVFRQIARFAGKLKEVVTATEPDEAQIEIGVGFSIEAGQLTAVLLKGTAEGNVKVTLKWTKSQAMKN